MTTDREPPTPEERFDRAHNVDWHEAYDSAEKVMVLRDESAALRDMIASRDAETNRYLAVLTRHDNELTLLRTRQLNDAQIEALRRVLGAAAAGDAPMAQSDFDALLPLIEGQR